MTLSDDSTTDTGPATRGQGVTSNAAMAEMQKKLRQAAKHISQLTREKQQLIEMGNRLRGELHKFGEWQAYVIYLSSSSPAGHKATTIFRHKVLSLAEA